MELKAEQETPKTSLLIAYSSKKNWRLKREAQGFTLIEMLLVIGILAFISVVAIPRFESTNSKMRREVRALTVLMKRLHHLARLNRQSYRLVIDFPENDDHKYWAESTGRKVIFSKPNAQEKSPEEEAKEQAATGFQLDSSATKNPLTLPKGIFFESLEISNRDELITSGRAYIHFLPQGMAEESALVLTDKKDLHWTIVLNPLTGQGEIVDGKTSLKEMREK